MNTHMHAHVPSLFSGVNVNFQILNGIATIITTKRTFKRPGEGLQKPLKEYGRQMKMQRVIIFFFNLKTYCATFEREFLLLRSL